MKRRQFLPEITQLKRPRIDDLTSSRDKNGISKFANKSLPQFPRISSGLEPYSGPWGFDQISHLLRRAMFGPKRSEITNMMSYTLSNVVELLLADSPAPNPPVNTNSQDTGVPVGQTWINAPKVDPNNPSFNPNSSRNTSLKSWWVSLMLNQNISLREKMTLYWHTHFVTETVETSDARFSYKYNALLRQYALGNFKELTKQITIDPAMLKYLNGNSNTKTNPNENYARELQELFTIGKGPEIAPGNYTNYTEADVQAAAKVLTGWRDDATNISSYFTSSRHDTTNKQFSSSYANTMILGKTGTDGALEIDDLINMIFAQPETAKAICRKIYRWFVYYVIDSAAESTVIEPLATIFRNNNYEIKPVLRALFNSAHFFDAANIGCMIKNPIELAVGLCRHCSVAFPTSADYTKQYDHWKYLRTQSSNMQMDVGDPPNVAGWQAYYQTPQFYELWINSDTLPKRNQFTDTLIKYGYTKSGFTTIVDCITFALETSNPSNPNTLINDFAQLLFPIAITDNQKGFLKNTLIPGLPDYEWTVEWNDYLAHPTDQTKKNAVNSKLQALLSFMCGMSEYQLM